MSNTPILVTGCAGFIGYHLCARLLKENFKVLGVDNLNDYYDPQLKKDRLQLLLNAGLQFLPLDLSQKNDSKTLFQEHDFQSVVHLAAQAGVRYARTQPHAYTASNIEGFLNVLEGCRVQNCEHLIYASSSSVYGLNQKLPFSTEDLTDRPASLYGATKKSNELMAHSYSWLYGIPTTGLRFFTVYGPWGRPDMSLYIFAKAILEDKPVQLFNHGEMKRDFTYVDDIVESIIRLIPKPPESRPHSPRAQLFNIGNNRTVELKHFLQTIENHLGRKAVVDLQPMQAGDVLETLADVGPLERYVDFKPSTPLEEGIARALDWYLDYRARRGV